MKHLLDYSVENIDSLPAVLGIGLSGYAIQSAEHGRITSIWFFFRDNIVVEIQGTMTTVEPWQEVGTLFFRRIMGTDNHPPAIKLGPAWAIISSVEKLVIEEEGFSAASGVVVCNSNGAELVIVCGAYPYTLEILAPFYDGDFQPEYDLSAYNRVPLELQVVSK